MVTKAGVEVIELVLVRGVLTHFVERCGFCFGENGNGGVIGEFEEEAVDPGNELSIGGGGFIGGLPVGIIPEGFPGSIACLFVRVSQKVNKKIFFVFHRSPVDQIGHPVFLEKTHGVVTETGV